MSDKVVKFYPKDAADDPDMVLDAATGEYNSLLILGWDKEGGLDIRANNGMTHKDCLWVMEVFKQKLLNDDYGDE